MRVDAFDFDLPRACIADRPAVPRDAARLLDVTEAGCRDRGMRDLPGLLEPGDVLVVNDTRVIPVRLEGRRGAARVEVTLHRREAPDTWLAFARPARRLKPGDRLTFGDGGFSALVEARGEGGEARLRFDRGGDDLLAALGQHGTMPLPPYMGRPGDERDRSDYQTIFAAEAGAVAAPTAGLHMTEALLAALDHRGVRRVTVTLHVGAGTFLPVRVDDTRDHRMHAEWGRISPEACTTMEAARAAGGRVVALGTTSLRLLESAADEDGRMRPFAGETAIFITPGYRFRAVDLLVTNFHLPRSTLFMLVCAFAGMERMQAAYRHAIDRGYRFYSYGDGSLLRRQS
ncbi:MAG: tRNA preQ1(34) S-adenosylmethionine ribosyltransferase-isomerase QueA [Alphaproteobacteria bacterium]